MEMRSTAVDRRRLRAAVTLFLCTARIRRAWHLILILGAGCPGATLAQTHFTPYADAAYEYNSNFFALANNVPEPLGSSGPTRSDSFEKYKAGFEAVYDWSLQEFFANAEGRRFEYKNFTTLDHDEYLVHGGLKWKLASLLDGVLDYQRVRSQVSYLQFNATQLSFTQLYLQVQDVGSASINIQLSPEWRLENQGKVNNLDSPRPGYPNLTVRENSIDEGFKYVGFANLSAGLVAEYLDGHFTSGAFLVSPKYHQTSADFAADYTLSGLSIFHGAIGYTNRDEGQAGNVSGLTGLISYERDLTGKTSVSVKVGRAINVYVTAAAPEIDTTAEINAVWNATTKIGAIVGYQYLHSNIGATDIIGVIAPARVDRLQTPSLSVKYQVLDWLSLRPYMQYQKRGSSDPSYVFSGNMYGIELEARLGQPQPLTLVRPY
jgi:hypothetical protein